MPRIRCHYTDCVFVDEGYCGAAAVELDPDTGCATYSPTEDAAANDEEWEEESEEWEEEEGEEEDDDLWDEDEDEI
jgi:ribosomal protein L12E/L44/L45/RPP1/RPP2